MKEYTLSEVQEITTDILRNVADTAEKEDLTYFAIFGTLLGTIRHGGPIPWDYDVDLYVPENEIEHFVEVLEKRLPDRYWVNYRNEGGVPQKFPRIGLKGYETEMLHVDIFRMVAVPDDEKEEETLWKRARFWSKIWKAKVIDPDYYYRSAKRRIQAKLVKVFFAPLSLEKVVAKMDGACRVYTVGETKNVGNAFRVKMNRRYPTSYFSGHLLKPYCDFQIRVPLQYEEILKTTYGDYMKFPPESERRKMEEMKYVIRELHNGKR